MTVERLTRRRFKVIAMYPESELPIGTIIEYDIEAAWITLNGELLSTKTITAGALSSYYFDCVLEIQNYPHLFRRLEWWEDRNVEDMPKYVKYVSNGKVYEAIKYLENNSLVVLTNDYWKIEIKNQLGEPFWMPATELEYTNYIKQNTK